MHCPHPSHRTVSTDLSPLDAFTTDQSPFATPETQQLPPSNSLLRLLASPASHSPLSSSTSLDWSTEHSLPPVASCSSSISAVDDTLVFDRVLPGLEQLDGPLALRQPASTSTDERWPGDDPLSSSTASASAMSLSHSSSSSSPSSGSRSLLASPVPQPRPSREQRKLGKRQKQRKADLLRRKREWDALSEMKELIAAAKQLTDNHRGNTATVEAETPHRVQILESSAAHMRELQLLVNMLSQTCDAQQREIHAQSDRVDRGDSQTDNWSQGSTRSFSVFQQVTGLDMSSAAAPSKRIRLLASSMSSTLNATLGHQSLQLARCAPVALALMLTDCATGIVLDVNEGMTAQGWLRSDMVGHAALEGYDVVMDERGWEVDDNLAQQVPLRSTLDGQLRAPGLRAQFESTKRLIRELYAGERGMCVVLWRMPMPDGQLHEVEKSVWIDGWEGLVDARGQLSRRPLRVVSATSYSDARRID